MLAIDISPLCSAAIAQHTPGSPPLKNSMPAAASASEILSMFSPDAF